MERFLNELERRWGRHSLDNFTLVLVTAQAATYVLSLAKPEFARLLVLDPYYVREGQVWRLVTYVFVPPLRSPMWALISLYFTYIVGQALETQWGAFKYQLFWLFGALLTAVSAFTFDVGADNEYLLMALFLAFATVWPRYEFMLFFIFPVQVRWLALLDAIYLLIDIGRADGWHKLVPLVAVGNYLLFFGPTLLAQLRGKYVQGARQKERKIFQREEPARPHVRRCATCGITSESDPDMDFRVCTCAKHDGKPTEFCLPHARNH